MPTAKFSLTPLTLAIAMLCLPAFASDISTETDETADLGVLVVTASKLPQAHPLSKPLSVSDTAIKSSELKRRSVNLGDSLGRELGIHANGFGGGASAPVIRGQEGKRIKILATGSETLDMSSMSPDHAITTDSVLARQVEVVRGVTPLLYSSGNSAGVVNVIDNKIPTQSLSKPMTAELGVRYNTADNEKLTHGAMSVNLGRHFVGHIEGLSRDANDYATAPHVLNGERLDKLTDSFSNSKSGSVGLSWVGDKGYFGVSASQRDDEYGLPAHSHIYDNYYVDVFFTTSIKKNNNPALRPYYKGYLKYYPFLADEFDINYNNPGISCKNGTYGMHNTLCINDHNHSGGSHTHSPSEKPQIKLTTERYDVRGEWYSPMPLLSKIKLIASTAHYRHDEQTGSVVDTAFKNTGQNARLELVHAPFGRLTGAFGVQYLNQEQHALDKSFFNSAIQRQNLLHDHTAKNESVFWLERLDFDKIKWEFATRYERQKIAMDYNLDIKDKDNLPPDNLTAPRTDTARSYATSLAYTPNSRHTLSMTLSHQERLPNAQELYAHGKHLATNSFELGNKNLNKEKSNNAEIGWQFVGDKWDWTVNGYYNQFDNYIYLGFLNDPTRKLCVAGTNNCITPSRSAMGAYPLRIQRYYQSKADIYGAELALGYHLNDNERIGIFGDYVRGKLSDLPSLPNGYVYDNQNGKIVGLKSLGEQKLPDGNAPRMPPARFGVRYDGQWGDNWGVNAEWIKVFDQHKTAHLESPTKGYQLVNVGVNYDNRIGNAKYSVFLNANNLFNAQSYNHASYLPYIPQMGRSFSLGVNVKY